MVVGVVEGVGETHSLDESPLLSTVIPVTSSKGDIGLVRVEQFPLDSEEAPVEAGPYRPCPFAPTEGSQLKSIVEDIRVPAPFKGEPVLTPGELIGCRSEGNNWPLLPLPGAMPLEGERPLSGIPFGDMATRWRPSLPPFWWCRWWWLWP